MPPTIIGRKFPSLGAANARINIEKQDWVPPIPVDIGGGVHVPHASLPAEDLTEAYELEDGTFFVPDVEGAVFTNDTTERKEARRQDKITGQERKKSNTPSNNEIPALVAGKSLAVSAKVKI